MIERVNKKTNLIYILLMLVPFVDVLNGIVQLELNINLSFGLIFRIFLLITCVYYLMKKPFKTFPSSILLFVIYLFVSIFFHFEANIIDDLRDAITISLIPLLYLTINHINKENKNAVNLNKILKWYTIAFPLTLIIPYFLGIGYLAYEDSGYKGFYIALNAISNMIVITSIISIYNVFKKYNLFNIIAFISNTFCILIMGTKSAYLIYAIVFLYFMVRYINNKRIKTRNKLFFLATFVLVILFMFLFIDKIQSIFDRWLYFFEKRSFISFLTSARSERIIPAIEFIFDSKYSIVYSLFGFGNIVNPNLEYNLIEMDLFDILFQHGLIGLFFIIYFVIKIYLSLNNKPIICKFTLITIIILSIFVGHVLTNALSATMFAIMLSYSKKFEYKYLKSKNRLKLSNDGLLIGG